MERKIKKNIPAIILPPTTAVHQMVQEKDIMSKAKHKVYADWHRRAREKHFKVGDKVLLRQTIPTTTQ